MAECTPMLRAVLTAVLCLLALGILLCLIRAIRGPRYTDRVIALNEICTLVIFVICICPICWERHTWWMWLSSTDYLICMAVAV